MMPGIGGIELIKHLNAMGNFVPIVVMSSIDDVETIQQVYSLGVLGFMPKYYSVEEIIEAINQCHNGEIHIPSKISPYISLGKAGERRKKIRFATQHSDSDHQHNELHVKLTKRQLEILSLMDRGLSNLEMARTLHISMATVKTHIQHLYNAFGVNNRVNCLRAAKKHRLR